MLGELKVLPRPLAGFERKGKKGKEGNRGGDHPVKEMSRYSLDYHHHYHHQVPGCSIAVFNHLRHRTESNVCSLSSQTQRLTTSVFLLGASSTSADRSIFITRSQELGALAR